MHTNVTNIRVIRIVLIRVISVENNMGKTKTAFIGEAEDKNKEKHEKSSKGKEEKVHLAGLKGGQRVKIVEAAPTEEKPVFEEGRQAAPSEVKSETKKKVVEKVRSKKYQEAKAKIDREKFYKIPDAVKFVKEMSYSKFDGTMELHIVVKKTGTGAQVTLPHAAGRVKKVEVASDDTVTQLQQGKIDFDVLIATPAMMPKIVPFAKLLGPKGLMPNPKNGTLSKRPKKSKSWGKLLKS